MNDPTLGNNATHFGQPKPSLLTTTSPTERSTSLIDSELFIQKAFETDPRKGYELLFKRYYQPLCNHAVRFVYGKDIAEDLVTEVFSQFWQKQVQHAVTTSYRAYLFTTVRHAAFAHLRKEFGREILWEDTHETITENVTSTPHQELQFNELFLRIEQIIRSMPLQCQKVFVMSRFEGKKNTAIAEELQISMKTVEGHITKALSVLRQCLRDYGFIIVLMRLTFWPVGQGVELLFSLL